MDARFRSESRKHFDLCSPLTHHTPYTLAMYKRFMIRTKRIPTIVTIVIKILLLIMTMIILIGPYSTKRARTKCSARQRYGDTVLKRMPGSPSMAPCTLARA